MDQTSVQTKPRLSLKLQALATLWAIIAAVVLPQFCHLLGISAGVGSALGEILLPMHFPILLVGLLAGPAAGAAAGAISPLLSFLLTEMPRASLLPFMTIELCVYGLCTGLLRNSKLPTLAKVALAQLAGRIVRAAAILSAVYLFESAAVPPSVIWNSIVTGLLGLLLQWILLPLIIYRVERAEKK